MHRTHTLIVLGLGLVLACVHVVASQNLVISEVDIVDFAYIPPAGVSSVGSAVAWTNQGNRSHTVTFDNGQGSSVALANGQSFTYIFRTTGRYSYHCAIHPSMTGYVDVLPNPDAPPQAYLPIASH